MILHTNPLYQTKPESVKTQILVLRNYKLAKNRSCQGANFRFCVITNFLIFAANKLSQKLYVQHPAFLPPVLSGGQKEQLQV